MTTHPVIRAIHRIPIQLDLDTMLTESYVTERKLVRTKKQLKLFIKRWQSIWQVPWVKDWHPSRMERQLVSGRYDPELAMRCISKNGTGGCGCYHLIHDGNCISFHIMIPNLLMRLMEISKGFNVPEGVALLQLTRALNDDLRNEDPDIIFGG